MVRRITLIPFLVLALLMLGSTPWLKRAAVKSWGRTDPSGSVVSGVSITITNTATNESRRATTDALGKHLLPFVFARHLHHESRDGLV